VDGLLEEQYGPWLAAVERSPFMRNYLLLDLYLSAARRAEEWGHDLYAVFPELADLGALSGRLPDGNGFVERCRLVLTRTLTLRNQWAEGERFVLLNRARSFIDGDYANPDLSLADAAAVAGLSPGHFSSLFGKEFGTTFKEYLTRVRMGHARKLLRSTAMRSFEVAAAVGYADPHYFSTVFKKETGQTPREYREAR
jgi:two-component system response regulator YesN